MDENISNFVVSIVPADALAPYGARASAVTVLIMFALWMNTGPALGGLIHWPLGDLNEILDI